MLANPVWADPADPWLVKHDPPPGEERRYDVDPETHRPLFPMRTGVTGRGLLGKWGENGAADTLLTYIEPKSGRMRMLVIKRGDTRGTNQVAAPGGMLEKDNPMAAARKELREEAKLPESLVDGAVCIRDRVIVDDPRNTDNAWMVSTVFHKHLNAAEVAVLLNAQGDDDADWAGTVEVNAETLGRAYASHGELMRDAIARVAKDPTTSPDEVARLRSVARGGPLEDLHRARCGLDALAAAGVSPRSAIVEGATHALTAAEALIDDEPGEAAKLLDAIYLSRAFADAPGGADGRSVTVRMDAAIARLETKDAANIPPGILDRMRAVSVHYRKGEWTDAAAGLVKSVSDFEGANDVTGAAESRVHLGRVRANAADDAAKKAAASKKAAAEATSKGSHEEAATKLDEAADWNAKSAELRASAGETYDAAANALPREGASPAQQRTWVHLRLNQALHQQRLGNLEGAIALLNENLETLEQEHYVEGKVQTLYNLGILHIARSQKVQNAMPEGKDREEALKAIAAVAKPLFDEAEKITTDGLALAITRQQAGVLCSLQGDVAGARELFGKALAGDAFVQGQHDAGIGWTKSLLSKLSLEVPSVG